MHSHANSISALTLVLAACAANAHDPRGENGATSASLVVGFDAAAGELPEGITTKDHFAYVGFAPLGQIARVDLRSGETKPFASLPTPAPNKGFMTGLAFGPDGRLYAALASFDPSVQAGIYQVFGGGGAATLFAKDAQMAFPNGLFFDAEGALFVTDSASATIFKVAKNGQVSKWVTSPLLAGDPSACGGSGNPFAIGANGLTGVDGTLFVSNTDKGSIVRIDVAPDGSPSSPKVAVGPDCHALAGADGLTVDSRGDLIIAVNRQNKILRLAPSGELHSVLPDGAPVDFPASLAWDDGALLATNFALASAMTGKPASPGILTITNQQPTPSARPANVVRRHTQEAVMKSTEETMKANKATVVRFNKEVIERGNVTAFRELMAPEFIDRTAPPGAPTGAEGMAYAFNQILRPALPDLRVEIHAQVAEGDTVTTRKTIHGTHRGDLLGIPATNRTVAIDVIDIVRLENGRYVEHWGVNTLPSVLAALQQQM